MSELEQRARIESEILPRVVDDPDWAADRIAKLEAEVKRKAEIITDYARSEQPLREAIVAERGKSLSLDIENEQLGRDVRKGVAENKRLREAMAESCDEARSDRMDCPRSARLEVENKRLRDVYNELVMAVATKVPGESRHETALRYILEREQHCSGPANALEVE